MAGITLDLREAERRLTAAHVLAFDPSVLLPIDWLDAASDLGGCPSKTLITGFGAALLAKATDERVDPLSIKSDYSSRSFSLRNLCHSVLVPMSRCLSPSFDLGTTGSEPMNNQPYFRYDHLTEVERVAARARPFLEKMKVWLEHLDQLGRDEALSALAAYIRIRGTAAQATDGAVALRRAGGIRPRQLLSIVERFVGEGVTHRPARLQALVAGLLACSSSTDVSQQLLNDPSRRFPGDIHMPHDAPRMCVEVKTRPMRQDEAQQFVDACQQAGVQIAWVVVLHGEHVPLDRAELLRAGIDTDVLTLVIESLEELLSYIFGSLTTHMLERHSDIVDSVGEALRQVGAPQAVLRDWYRVAAEANSPA